MNASPSTSLLTIVRGRETHLRNQAIGVAAASIKPDQWVIVGMGEPPPDVREMGIDGLPEVITDWVPEDGDHLPLAAARNHAATIATGDRLVFLDVDCIPAPGLIGGLAAALDDDVLWMGNPRYLPSGSNRKGWTFEQLDRVAATHPLMPELEPGEILADRPHEMFWSLVFAINKSTFERVGGFDESFRGYGGEDTDFAFNVRQAQIEFRMIGHAAYHQHHAVCKPPLNHFADIVVNAEAFRQKWMQWPMESWLEQFAQRDLIRWPPEGETIEILRHPTPDEVSAATTNTPAGF